MTDHIHDDGSDPCPDCGEASRVHTCEECGATARVIDCGHQSQPRPVAADAGGHDLCDDCAD